MGPTLNGIYAEKVSRDGQALWMVRDAKTGQLLAIGATLSAAVENYEIALENEKMAEVAQYQLMMPRRKRKKNKKKDK